MKTLGQTPDISKVKRSCTSFWHTVGNPPNEQLNMWSIVKWALLAQCEGNLGGVHQYRKHTTFQKVVLWRTKPWASRGNTVWHLEAPFSWANSMAHWSDGGKCAFIASAAAFKLCRLSECPWSLILSVVKGKSGGNIHCCVINRARGADTRMEYACSWAAVSTRLGIPSPPKCTGRYSRSRSRSPGGS